MIIKRNCVFKSIIIEKDTPKYTNPWKCSEMKPCLLLGLCYLLVGLIINIYVILCIMSTPST